MEDKIDNILTSIKNRIDTNVNLVKRIASLEEKFDKYDDSIAEFNQRLAKQEHKIKNISNDLEEKVSLTDYHELRDRIARLEFEEEANKLELQRESYSKRLNLLIHGLDEVGSSAWETKTQNLDIFNKFMTDELGLDPKSISLLDIHRLPQRPIVKQGSNITRPIVIKLATAMDKHTVMSNLKNLKAYNLKKQVGFDNEHFHADHHIEIAQYSSLITRQRNSMKERRSLCQPSNLPANLVKKQDGQFTKENTVYLWTIN